MVAFIFGILAALFWRAIHPAEPSYQGRSATEWLAQFDATFSSLQIRVPNSDHGDRYEAVLAFRAMGDDGLAYLVHTAMPGTKVDWRTRIGKLLPDRAQSWLQRGKLKSETGPYWWNAQVLINHLEPSSASLLPLLSGALKNPDNMTREVAADLLRSVRREDAVAVLPLLFQAAADLDESVAFNARMDLSTLPITRPKELFPAAVKQLTPNGQWTDFALRVVMELGEEARSAAPLIETLRQNASAETACLATIALLQLNPERTELLASLTNALVGTNPGLRNDCVNACHAAGPKASLLVPFLKGISTNRETKLNEIGPILSVLCLVSPVDGVDALAVRLRASNDPADRLLLAFELVRIAPSNSKAQALAMDILEMQLPTHFEGEKQLVDNPVYGIKTPLDYLLPPGFKEPPHPRLLQLLERISKDHEDKTTRHTATQALKYFHLRWPKN